MTLYRFLVCLLFLFSVRSVFFACGNLFISDKNCRILKDKDDMMTI